MRVIIVSPHDPRTADSGDRVRTTRLAEALHGLGLDVYVLFPTYRGGVYHLGESWSGSGYHVVEFEVESKIRRFVPRVVWRVWLWVCRRFNLFALFGSAYRRSLAVALDQLEPDVVDFQHSFTWCRTRFPSVCTVHNVEAVSTGRRRNFLQTCSLRSVEGDAVRAASSVVCFSLDDRNRISTLYDRNDSRVVPIGIGDPQNRIAIRPRMRVCGFVGSFDYEPNVVAALTLVNWWQGAGRNLSQLSKLVIVGRYAASLCLPIVEGVEVRSDVPNVRAAVEDVDILLAPISRGGGVRVKLIEGMAFGLPIITTPLGCEGLQITPGVEMVLIDDIGDLDDALLALEPDVVRARLANSAHRFWLANFSPVTMAETMRVIYGEVAA